MTNFPTQRTRRDRAYGVLALVLGTIWLSMGCSPANIGFLLAPFFPDTIPARCKLSSSDREVTVAIVSSFSTGNVTRTELIGAENDLAERLAQGLTKSFKDNKEKVKFVPLGQVRAYQKKMSRSGVVSDQEIGKHFKADYVLTLDVNGMDLYEPGSSRMLFRGRADVGVRVLDLSKDSEGVKLEDSYTIEYPRSGPVDAGNTSPLQFRAVFLERMAKELCRWFSAYPAEQKRDMID